MSVDPRPATYTEARSALHGLHKHGDCIASMPRALGERFEGRLARSLSAVLKGLADDADSVREAALEAGGNLVSAYAKTSLEHLLPLLSAMREKLWRIRQAATRLLGDLLLVIAEAAPERPDIFGQTDDAGNDVDLGKEGSDEEGNENGDNENGADEQDFESPEHAAAAMSTEAAMKAIEDVLGFERRNEVLAALYVVRCDISIRVHQKSAGDDGYANISNVRPIPFPASRRE